MSAKPPDIEKQLEKLVPLRWTALRLLATAFGLLSLLSLAAGVGYGVILMMTPVYHLSFDADNNLIQSTEPPNVGLGLTVLIGGVLLTLVLAAAAQFTRLQVANEHHQRVTNVLLAKLLKRRGDE